MFRAFMNAIVLCVGLVLMLYGGISAMDGRALNAFVGFAAGGLLVVMASLSGGKAVWLSALLAALFGASRG